MRDSLASVEDVVCRNVDQDEFVLFGQLGQVCGDGGVDLHDQLTQIMHGAVRQLTRSAFSGSFNVSLYRSSHYKELSLECSPLRQHQVYAPQRLIHQLELNL
jgi:hypothetical protein